MVVCVRVCVYFSLCFGFELKNNNGRYNFTLRDNIVYNIRLLLIAVDRISEQAINSELMEILAFYENAYVPGRVRERENWNIVSLFRIYVHVRVWSFQ